MRNISFWRGTQDLPWNRRREYRRARGLSYHCVIAFSRTTGEIVQVRDYSCPAGKRGYCKHVAALAYKLVDSAMTKKESLLSSLTCTQIKQKWGLPSLRAEQDPEKEMLKRQPLQTISIRRQILDRDLSGGRKRKLPNETLSTYSSKPVKEPFISVSDFDNLAADLNKSKCQSTLLLAIKAGRKAVNSGVNSSTTVVQHSELLAEKETFTSKQGSNEWYKQRVGKITSSKLPTLIGFSGKNEFDKAWECIRNKVQEETKSFQNFKRGKIYESIADDTFEHSSGLKLSESPLILHPNDPEHYAASPDRILDVGSIFLRSYESDELIELNGKYILEIKTRAIGSVKPLELINASHVEPVSVANELHVRCDCDNFIVVPSWNKKVQYVPYQER